MIGKIDNCSCLLIVTRNSRTSGFIAPPSDFVVLYGGLVSDTRLITLGILLCCGVASPAAATDCFIRVRSADAAPAAPAHRAAAHRRAVSPAGAPHIHHVRHGVGARHARRQAIAVDAPVRTRNFAESSLQMRTMPVYVMRPTSCDAQPPATLQSLAPAEYKPPAQLLLDELAGPASRAAAAPGDLPASAESGLTPVALAPGGVGGGGPVGGGPVIVGPGGGGPGAGGPGGGGPVEGPPSTTPPQVQPPLIGPPDVPPVIIAPPGPPVVGPPGGGPPPVMTPPGTTPPVTAAVPEPSTWAMMILGFLGVGGALRARRTRRAPEIVGPRTEDAGIKTNS
jgi:hypothetical protein